MLCVSIFCQYEHCMSRAGLVPHYNPQDSSSTCLSGRGEARERPSACSACPGPLCVSEPRALSLLVVGPWPLCKTPLFSFYLSSSGPPTRPAPTTWTWTWVAFGCQEVLQIDAR